MKRIVWTLLAILFFSEIFSFLPKPDFVPDKSELPYLQGAIHVHSLLSDGSGTPENIAEQAKRAGLDFVVLTDDAPKSERSKDKSYNGLDVFNEAKFQLQAGKALSFYSHVPEYQSHTPAEMKNISWEHYLGREKSKLFVVVAHPSHVKTPWTRLDRYPEGIELINLNAIWERSASDSPFGFFISGALYPINPFLSVSRFYQVYSKDFSAWDSMNAINPGHFAIVGHDVRAKVKGVGPYAIPWPAYETTFRIASNVVFLKGPPAKDLKARKEQIYDSIRGGRLAIHYRPLGSFEGNEWKLVCEPNEYRSGEVVRSTSDNCYFLMKTPTHFPFNRRFELWHDGTPVFSSQDKGTVKFQLVGPGTYRLTVWAEPTTWSGIFFSHPVPYVIYNPIYVR